MSFVRVRHPQTGDETRVAAYQYEKHLAALGFALVGDEPEPAPEASSAVTSAAQTSDEDTGGGDTPTSDGDPLADLLGDVALADALRAADLGTPEAIRDAPDEALRAIKGIGPGRLKKLREYAAGAATDEEASQ